METWWTWAPAHRYGIYHMHSLWLCVAKPYFVSITFLSTFVTVILIVPRECLWVYKSIQCLFLQQDTTWKWAEIAMCHQPHCHKLWRNQMAWWPEECPRNGLRVHFHYCTCEMEDMAGERMGGGERETRGDENSHKDDKSRGRSITYFWTLDIIFHVSLVKFINELWLLVAILSKPFLKSIKHDPTQLLHIMLLPCYKTIHYITI